MTDDTLRFFAAARDDQSEPAPSASRSSHSDATTLDFSRFRARRVRERLFVLLDALVIALERHDGQAVWDLLDEADARRCFPTGVGEEALFIASLPATMHRVPLRLYRYYHVLRQLGDEPSAPSTDEAQLSLCLSAPVDATPVAASVRK